MLFFIGSMQLIVLSDNLLMVFFGWEGVGLASYALIGFWYHDRKKDYVGVQGHIAGGTPMWASPTHAGKKAFLMKRAGDTIDRKSTRLNSSHANLSYAVSCS